MTAKLIALVIPLGFDTFGVALVLGMAGLPPRTRMRISLLFTCFEAGMPLIGIVVGAPLGHAIGGVADYAAAGLIVALGAYMLLENADKGADERDSLRTATGRGLVGAVALGVSISLDELAIGFGAGLLRLPIVPLIIAIGLQTLLVTQAGIRLGGRLGDTARERAETVAGVALIALGVVLAIERLTAT